MGKGPPREEIARLFTFSSGGGDFSQLKADLPGSPAVILFFVPLSFGTGKVDFNL